jgi:threonine dehydratase
MTIDGGRTLFFELQETLSDAGAALDHLVIQVGGGAFASASIRALEQLREQGRVHSPVKVHLVQTTGAAPLQRCASKLQVWRGVDHTVEQALNYAARRRSEFMWPWEETPTSIATGILDDETYDWLKLIEGLFRSDGEALVVSEEDLECAHRIAHQHTQSRPCATGAAGLAGVIALRREGRIGPDDTVGVVFSGIER